MTTSDRPLRRVLFVTGRLAEPALRRVLQDMAPPFACDVAVLGITVASLMTTAWIARFLDVPDATDIVLIPGLCEGDPQTIADAVRRADGEGPEGSPGDSSALRAERGRPGVRRLGHRDRRRDQQRAEADSRGGAPRGGIFPRLGRRHHRHRLHAGRPLPRPRRCRPRPRGRRHAGQRRHLRPGRDPHRGRRRRRARAERQRIRTSRPPATSPAPRRAWSSCPTSADRSRRSSPASSSWRPGASAI